MTKWLTKEELASWLELAGVMLRLNPALDSQLVRDSDLTHFGYLCLAMLSERDDRTQMMSTLASNTNSSLSRLSHVVTKLETRGYVERMPCEHSRRITMVRLTDEGYAALVAAAPGHVAQVRSLVYDGLSDQDVEDLRRIMSHIRTRLDNIDVVCDKPA